MRKVLILAVGLFLGSLVKAADYDYLVLRQADGTAYTLKAIGLKLTFDNGNITAASSDSTLTLPLAGLSSMNFTATAPTGIAFATASDSGINVSDGHLRVAADCGAHITVTNLAGMTVAERQAHAAGEQVFDNLPKGLYMVRVNNTTAKIQIR